MASPITQPVSGLDRTWQVLGHTQNEAAVSVLVAAIDSPLPAVQDGALRTILQRRSPLGQKEVLRRLHTAAARWRAIIAERPGRMTHALRDAVLGPDEQMCINALQAIIWFREYDLAPALITAIEDETHERSDLAAQTLLELVELLYSDLAASGGPRRRDPQLVRNHVLSALENSVKRFAKHRRTEVIEAFLTLVNRDNSTLKQLLQDPHHASYLPLVDGLLHNERGGVIRLLLSFLDDPHAPSAAVAVLSRRADRKFVGHLLRRVGYQPGPAAAANLRRIETLSWLKTDRQLIDALDDTQQHALVRLLIHTGIKRHEIFPVIEHLLREGKPGGRRAAADALAEFPGAEANQLTLDALRDSDPQVVASAARQLRARSIPGALTQLISLVDSPHETVRAAARESLSEFNFERFLAAFEMLDEEVRQSTGVLVRKISDDYPVLLLEELQARSRTRRLRGIEVAMAMRAAEQFEAPLIALLADDDHLVRMHAARALGQCRTETARAALVEAQSDRSVLVQEAAAASLALLRRTATDGARTGAGQAPVSSTSGERRS